MYFAVIDLSVSKGNPGNGFANTKAVVCFYKKEHRDEYVAIRKEFDHNCHTVTPKYARSNVQLGPNNSVGWFIGDKFNVCKSFPEMSFYDKVNKWKLR